MAQTSILELAKQGNGEAIATLINRSIQAKGITATAHLDFACLNIDLRSPQTINQKAMVSLVRKGMLSLQVKTIKELTITGFQSDYETASDRQIWQVNFPLESGTESKSVETILPTSSEIVPKAVIVESVATIVHQPVQIKHIPPAYQDIIIRFIDPLYGNIKCLCTLTELVQVINNFSFGNANPALKQLLEAIAESTVIEENGDRLINHISVLQPGSQWQKAKIRLVVNIFFESEGYVPPTETSPAVITLEAIETPISSITEEIMDKKTETSKTPKQILLEDLSSLLTDLAKPKPEDIASITPSEELQQSVKKTEANDVLTLDELSKVW